MEAITAGLAEYYEPHPDVEWFEETAAPTSKPKRTYRPKQDAFDLDGMHERVARASRALSGVLIDHTYGQCYCWLCSDKVVPQHESDWMFRTLAKFAMGQPQPDRDIWVQEWTLRHGKFAGAVLQRHVDWHISVHGDSHA